jgi:hypothetical protein
MSETPTIMTSKCETKIEYDDVTQEEQERFMKEALLMVIDFSLSFMIILH